MSPTDVLAIAVAVSLPWSTSAAGLFIILWLLACLPALDLTELRRVVVTPVGGFPVLLWALGALGTLWAAVPWWDRLQGLNSFHRLLFIPLLLVQCRRSDNARWVLGGYLASCTVVLLLSLATAVWPDIWRPDNPMGPGVPLHDPTAQSAEFTMCASWLGYLAYSSWRAGRLGHALASLALALGFLGDVLFVATARTELVVAAALMVLAGVRARGLKGVMVGCVAVIALAAIAWNASGYLRYRLEGATVEIREYEESSALTSIGFRMHWWRESIPLIAEAPLFGHGTGTIKSLYSETKSDDTREAPFATSNPHNQTIVIAVQLGLAGVALLYAMWLAQILLFRAPGLYGWLGLTIVIQNVIGSLGHSHLFDFVNGWTYIWGVGVAGGIVLRAEAGTMPSLAAGEKPAAEASR